MLFHENGENQVKEVIERQEFIVFHKSSWRWINNDIQNFRSCFTRRIWISNVYKWKKQKNTLQSYNPTTLLWNETGEAYSFFEEYVPGI